MRGGRRYVLGVAELVLRAAASQWGTRPLRGGPEHVSLPWPSQGSYRPSKVSQPEASALRQTAPPGDGPLVSGRFAVAGWLTG